MAEILVLAEHAGETVKKVTSELLTLARGLGEPAVVWTGAGAEAARERLAEFGAAKVYVADSADFDDYVVAPKAELLASLVAGSRPAAVLVASTAEGREVAGRLAVKTGSGLLTDVGRPRRRPGRRAVDLRRRDHGQLEGPDRHADHRGPAERGHAGARAAARPRSCRPASRSATPPRPRRSPSGWSPKRGERPGADRGLDRGLRRPRRRRARELRADREAGRLARRGGRRLPRRHRRGLVSAPVPGRPDRQDRLAAAVRRGRHLRRDPAPGRHADLQDDHGRSTRTPRRRSSSWPTSASSATCSRSCPSSSEEIQQAIRRLSGTRAARRRPADQSVTAECWRS